MNLVWIFSARPWVEPLGWTLVHFLWQGVVIAAVYAAVRWRIRMRCSAQARYLLACAALLSMVAMPLLTFWRMEAPAQPHAGAMARTVQQTVTQAPLPTGVPVSIVAMPAPPERSWSDDGMPLLVELWFAGVLALWLRLLSGCIGAERLKSRLTRPVPDEWYRTFYAIKARVGVLRPVKLLVSTLVDVPTVAGWLRPAVLVPVGMLTGLPAEHVEALLAHELAHIRRHDYLISVLQSVAEALLFYHPAVWWISGEIRGEREMCCDDIAVAISGDALTYARALTHLEKCRAVYRDAVFAANGGSLADRVARLLGMAYSGSRIVPGPGSVAAALILMVFGYGLFAQATAARPRFDVVSIKPAPGLNGRFTFDTQPGRLLVINNEVMNLITHAYDVKFASQVIGLPAWAETERYNVEAKAAGVPDREQMFLMLQSLLEDRFRLKVHREQRELPVFNLVAAKGGIKLVKRSEENCIYPDRTHPDQKPANPCGNDFTRAGRWTATNIDMAHAALSMGMDRPVIDKTGFQGTFDLDLQYRPELPNAEGSADPSLPSIFTVLQEQLGLKLEPAKGPVDVLVIDHIERPSAN